MQRFNQSRRHFLKVGATAIAASPIRIVRRASIRRLLLKVISRGIFSARSTLPGVASAAALARPRVPPVLNSIFST